MFADTAPLDARSLALRATILEMLGSAGRGHLGPAFSAVELLRVLYDDVLRVDPNRPLWPERDRFILSKGHGCLALYVLLAEQGFFPKEELATVGKTGSRLGGHPERAKIPGVEASTGSLGHGLSIGVGLALSARIQQRPTRVFALCGDGEMTEGTCWEACLHAAKHRLDNLTLIVDHNGLSSYGPIDEVCSLAPLHDKLRSFGFHTLVVDGHDVPALQRAFAELELVRDQPKAIVARTVKGRGLPVAEHNPAYHHANKVTREDAQRLMSQLSAECRSRAESEVRHA